MKVTLSRSDFAPPGSIYIAHPIDVAGNSTGEVQLICPSNIRDDLFSSMEKMVQAHNDFDNAMATIEALGASQINAQIPALIRELNRYGRV